MSSAPLGSQKHYSDGGTTDGNPDGVEHRSASKSSALDKGTGAAASTASSNNEGDPEISKAESEMKLWGSRGKGDKPGAGRPRQTPQKKSNPSTSHVQEQVPQATEGQNPPADAQKKGRAPAPTANSATTLGS